MTKVEIKRQLAAILKKIEENTDRLWQDNCDSAVDCAVLEDYTTGDSQSSDPEEKEVENKYNGWLEDLKQLQKSIY